MRRRGRGRFSSGQGLPSHVHLTIGEMADFRVLADDALGHRVLDQHNPLAVVGYGRLWADAAPGSTEYRAATSETFNLRCGSVARAVTAKRALNRSAKSGRNALSAGIELIPARRSSFTGRSYSVRLTRSTRPWLGWCLHAGSRCSARKARVRTAVATLRVLHCHNDDMDQCP